MSKRKKVSFIKKGKKKKIKIGGFDITDYIEIRDVKVIAGGSLVAVELEMVIDYMEIENDYIYVTHKKV